MQTVILVMVNTDCSQSTNVPVKMMVTTGLAPALFDVIDGNKVRTSGQMLLADNIRKFFKP